MVISTLFLKVILPRLHQADACAKKAITLNEKSAEAWNLLGLIALKGKTQSAGLASVWAQKLRI